MQRLYCKKTILSVLFLAMAFAPFAQETTSSTVKPFTGSKEFRKFSVGINVGATNPSLVIGGSNDFTKPKLNLGYGANLRYQFNHFFALQADYLGGKLKGDQSKEFGNEQLPSPAVRPIRAFETSLKYAASLSGQLTFGNINWLREKSVIVPYLSAGLGIADYKAKISRTGFDGPFVDYSEGATELFVPVGVGFKINLSPLMNLDLGYRMQFVDGDNLDGAAYYSSTPGANSLQKDKFSYAFAGLEFALGSKAKKQLLFDNPASRTNSNLQSQIDTVKTAIDALKNDTDGDGVADLFDKE